MRLIASRCDVAVVIATVTLIAFNAVALAGLDSGLALHLPLTADLKDHSAARHPIHVVGKVRVEADGAFFGGRRDWLEAPHIVLNQRPFAIAVWIRETSGLPTIGLLEQFDLNRPLRHFSLMLRETRHPYLSFMGMDLFSTLNVSSNEWVHLVFQYTGKEQQIWVNGRLLCSREGPPYEGDSGVTAIGKMPRWTNVPGKDFVGHLRDFRIYHRALDHQEIGNLAGLNQPIAQAANEASLAQPLIPPLGEREQATRKAMSQLLSPDPALPFLQIAGRQITVNGQVGQVYTLESSGNLQEWHPLVRMTNQTGRVVYEGPDQAFSPMQFFRVKVESTSP